MSLSHAILDVVSLFPDSDKHKYAYLLKVDKQFVKDNTFCTDIDSSPKKRHKRSLPNGDKGHVELGYASNRSKGIVRHSVNTSVADYTHPTGQRLLPSKTALESAQETLPPLVKPNKSTISTEELAEDDADGIGM